MNHENIFANLTSKAEDKSLLLTPKKTQELEVLMDKFEITLEEATLFVFLLQKFIQTGRSVSLDETEDSDLDIVVGNNNYLKIVKSHRGLIDKDLVTTESRRNRSSLMNPDISIDEGIFSQIVFGSDVFEKVDFSNIYSIIQAVDALFESRAEK